MIPLQIFIYTFKRYRFVAICLVGVFNAVIERHIPLINQSMRDLRQVDILPKVGTADSRALNDHSWFIAKRQNLWMGGQWRNTSYRCYSS